MWHFWLGGLGLGAGLGFIAGFFVGSWSLRRIGFAIRVSESSREAIRAKKPQEGWGLPEDGMVGLEHPNGVPPEMPNARIKRNPRSWLDKLPSKVDDTR